MIKTVSNSPLPGATDELITRIIGCAITVHRTLGPGFLERIYAEALGIELGLQGIPYERERSIVVNYRGTSISGQRVDLIVGDLVIVEIKATAKLDPIFEAKLLSYLRTTKLRAGLLINFNAPVLKDGLKRMVI
jgi:GxxExxY protein